MDLKEGMLFAGNVVDGRVHELGGWMLRIQHMMQQNVEVGQAVSTGPGGSRVGQEYDQIIHTVPPFYKHHEEPEQYLATCYQNALSLAISPTGSGESVRIACPLIESGSREFPTGMAFELQQKNQYSGEM
jgi:O-acetyl-ADP-ribose deacetylase (regulator of RNase III)